MEEGEFMKLIQMGMLAIALTVTSGCAFQKQAIKLAPKVEVEKNDLGAGKQVMVNVADERPRATLGTRGVSGIGEQLTVEGNLVEIVKAAVNEGLQRQGFAIEGPLENQLRVEIRNLDYTVNSGFWAGKLNVEFLLKGICIKDNNRPYEQIYRGEFRENIQVVQGEEANNTYVNTAVSSAINLLLADKLLLQCLAK
jgi:uncharacterized lipoprotein YajG